MIHLTEEQRRERDRPEPLAIDPRTNETYVLVRRDVHERLRGLLAADTVYTTTEMLDRTMAADDANDPYLAELQKQYGANG